MGAGFTLEMYMSMELGTENASDALYPTANAAQTAADRVHTFVLSLFSQAERLELFGNYVSYRVPRANVQSLARAFFELERGMFDR